jgi:hypothetical protein
MIFFIAFCVTWGSIFTLLVASDYLEFKKNAKKWATIEDKVTNFTKGNGRKEETFTVRKVKFSYRNNFIRHKALGYEGEGNVIKTGKYVKIDYYEGRILRLWVWEEAKKK